MTPPDVQTAKRMNDTHGSGRRPRAGRPGSILRPRDDIQLFDLAGFCKRLQQLFHRTVKGGMIPISIYFHKRFQHKPTEMETRMGNRQSCFMNDVLAHEEDVEIDGAWASTMLLIPAQSSFGFMKKVEKPDRTQRGFDADHAIVEPGGA
jgi:hypothetical protein